MTGPLSACVSFLNLSMNEGSHTSYSCWVLSQCLTTIIGRKVLQLSNQDEMLQIPPFCLSTALCRLLKTRKSYQVFPTLNAPEKLL